LSGTFEYFRETVLKDFGNGENFDFARPGFGYENSEDDEELVSYLQEFGEAISYFGFSYYYANRDSISAVPIQNSDGVYLVPTQETIGDGSYNPLARRIFMNLLNDDTLIHTAPFVKFGLLNANLVAATGYVALPPKDSEEMIARLNDPYSSSENGDDDGLSGGGIAGVAIAGAVVLCLIAFAIVKLTPRSDKGEPAEQAV
jgi:phosphate transport system substrate-binding protein